MGEDSAKELQTDEIEFYEPLTPTGCPRSLHQEITIGLGKFDTVICPRCKQEIYRA